MTTTVWVDGWQLECCGEPFAIGQRVTWDVHAPDREWLTRTLGADQARRIDWAEDHHGPIPADEISLTGVVVSLRVVHQRHAPPPGSAAPVVSLTRIRSTGQQGSHPGQMLTGFVVELNESA